MQATRDVKEAEAAEQTQSQDIRKLDLQESDLLDEHRLVGTRRAKLDKDLQRVTEDAQASRYRLFPKCRGATAHTYLPAILRCSHMHTILNKRKQVCIRDRLIRRGDT